MGASQIAVAAALLPELVQACRQPLRGAASTREHQRGTCLQDGRKDLLLHVRPGVGERGSRHRDVPLLDGAGSHHGHVPVTAEESRNPLNGAHRGGQGDPLHVTSGQQIEPLQTERQMCAAFGACDGMDLIDDDRLDATERLPG